MDTRAASCALAPSTACLLIHAEASSLSTIESALHRLRSRYSGAGRRNSRAALKLQVDDLKGRRRGDIHDLRL